MHATIQPESTTQRGQAFHGGSGGQAVGDPSGFIDAYWMGRYYGMILPPDTNDRRWLTVEKRGQHLGAKPYAGPPRPDVGF